MSAQATPAPYPNPLGINGFEFVEFAAPDAAGLHALFRSMGFTAVAKHKAKAITLYRQGGVNFLVNEQPDSFASDFAAKHGPSACGFAIRVRDGKEALQEVCKRGAEEVTHKADTKAVQAPVIKGIGDCMLYLVTDEGAQSGLYAREFVPLPGVAQDPAGYGLTFIDHLTHNLYFGNMAKWADYYERLFGFREIRYFDIKGEYTGLTSRAMTAPDGKIRIPLNEEGKAGGGQIDIAQQNIARFAVAPGHVHQLAGPGAGAACERAGVGAGGIATVLWLMRRTHMSMPPTRCTEAGCTEVNSPTIP